jgi:pSer/pThr/pTyr-binding forkhead associated (FHA) protein
LKSSASAVRVPDVRHFSRFLAEGPHFLASLRKRAGADSAFADRISVGRAPNKDLVLRHGSISKFHAYFQVDEQDCYYVADAGSKNGTTLNGSRLPTREPTPVQVGDFVVFGSVESLVMDARTLWRALRAA